MPFIYKITNLINNKIYVGKTTETIDKRWKEHKKDFKREKCRNRPLYKAMNKYGIENFSVELIEECNFGEESDREIYWIDKLDSYHNGYNATKGGDGKSYADYNKIFKLYSDGCNLSEIKKETGYDYNTISKVLTDKGISSHEKQVRGAKNITKSIAQLDKKTMNIIQIFPSIEDAYNYLNKQSSGHITEVCNGKRQTAYGYKWKYM